MSVLIYLASFVLAISVLVAVHEYGHYLVARLCGIKVLRFSIGFGKPIWSKRAGKDNTEYCIAALPLGGYVKMLDEREESVDPADATRTFQAQPIWQRIAVLLAGPAFNFLFVIVAFWLMFIIGVPTQQAQIGYVASDSQAQQAGMERGDVIEAVAGKPVAHWEQAFLAIIEDMVGDGTVTLDVRSARTDELSSIELSVPAGAARLESPGLVLDSLGFQGLSVPPIVHSVSPDSPAYDAGLKQGDVILSIDGAPVSSFNAISGLINTDSMPAPLAIAIERDGQILDVALTPMAIEDERSGEQRYILGVGSDPAVIDELRAAFRTMRYGPLAAIPAALDRTVAETAFTVRMLGRMLTGDVSVKNISGPVSIAKYSGDAAKRGFVEYVRLLALISISLGLLNLLPIPMLDGGQIVYQTVEWIKGSPLSDKAQLIGQQFGIILLLGVMVFAFYNDLSRYFSG